MLQWDNTGLRGIDGKYEVSVVPEGDGWAAIIWVNKTLIKRMDAEGSKKVAQESAEEELQKMDKMTVRLMDRIGYDDPENPDNVDEYY